MHKGLGDNMKYSFRRIIIAILALLFIATSATSAFAHSGRTDSSGGHKDNKNVSGLGYYHYHCGGYPAHLHTLGYCPYRDAFPRSVSISGPTTLRINAETSLNAKINPQNACNTSIYWSSSDPNIVSVDSNGNIIAKKYGTATIYAKTFNDIVGTVKIVVKEVTANKVTVSDTSGKTEFYIGEKINLTATISPEDVDNPSISWSSSDIKIATVTSDGNVNLLSAGKVEIKAKAANGVEGKFIINVKERYVETVDITSSEIDMLIGETQELKAIVSPQNATYPELTWEVADPSIVSVSSGGIVTALKCGETTITATSTNGISDSVYVSVSEIKAESLQIDCPAHVYLGDSIVLSAKFTPHNTTDQTVQWSVDNSSIASIANNGKLTAKEIGTVVVTAVNKDVSTRCSIEILPIKVEEIIISSNTSSVVANGDTVEFSAEVLPVDATYPDITWSVEDSKIASIDKNGILTPLKRGTTTVIATADDGFSSEYELTVNPRLPDSVVIASIVLIGVIALVLICVKFRK